MPRYYCSLALFRLLVCLNKVNKKRKEIPKGVYFSEFLPVHGNAYYTIYYTTGNKDTGRYGEHRVERRPKLILKKSRNFFLFVCSLKLDRIIMK